jgi:hypothetical protein
MDDETNARRITATRILATMVARRLRGRFNGLTRPHHSAATTSPPPYNPIGPKGGAGVAGGVGDTRWGIRKTGALARIPDTPSRSRTSDTDNQRDDRGGK